MTNKNQEQNNPEPGSILHAAEKNCASAGYLYNESIRLTCSEDKNESFRSVAYLCSAIVLYAFSSELGLKALLSLDGKKGVKGHNLKSLFGRLSPQMKEMIIESLPEDRFKVHFNTYLEENQNDFEEWRYYYEKTNIASSDFLKALSETIISVANRI